MKSNFPFAKKIERTRDESNMIALKQPNMDVTPGWQGSSDSNSMPVHRLVLSDDGPSFSVVMMSLISQ